MKKYPLNNVPYYTRFRDMLDGMSKGNEEKSALSWFTRKGEQQGVTWGQFHEQVLGLQAQMIHMGLAGKHIAIMGENSYEWLLTYFAATYCGAVAVCVDIEQPDDTIKQMLQMADVEALFYTKSCKDLCISFAGGSKPMVCFAQDEDYPCIHTLAKEGLQLLESGSVTPAQVTGDMTAAIVFTSGTTNYSKPVMLSQEAILTNAADAIANVTIGSIVFTSLPFYHTYGMNCAVIAMLLSGAHVFINGNLKTVMRDLQLSQANTMLTVPLMLETIHSKMWLSAEESGKSEGLRKLLKIRKFLLKLGKIGRAHV